jgi:hypothetical protein
VGCCEGTPPTSPNFDQLQDVLARQVIEHNWARDGWADFTPVVITADGAQSFSTIVTGVGGNTSGIGAAVSTIPGNASLRIAYLRNGTNWRDGEVRSTIWGPLTPWNGTNAQQGHLHRVRKINATTYEGIALWTSIVFGGDYSFLHVASVQFDGTTLNFNGAAGGLFDALDSGWIHRGVRVMGHRRFNFIDWINEYTIGQPHYARYWLPGTHIAVTSLSDATFNEADIALNTFDTNGSIITVKEPTTLSAVSYAVDGTGGIAPIGEDLQKKWCPFTMATRVIGGTAGSVTVEAKRWRLGDPEPDWGEARVRRGPVLSGGSISSVALGPGLHGLWGAHFNGGSAGGWGDLQFRCVTAGGCAT